MFCTKCGSESVFKSGFVKGEQRLGVKGVVDNSYPQDTMVKPKPKN